MTATIPMFDMEKIDAGHVVLMPAPEFPRQCRLHPQGVGWSCQYGVCERAEGIQERRNAGESVGTTTKDVPVGSRVRDIYWLTEYSLIERKKDHIWMRVEKSGPGRRDAIGSIRDQWEPGDRRYELMEVSR
jgi:hypothetical protein